MHWAAAVRRAADYLPRKAIDLVLEALADTRVVVVNGARQVGKSTLAELALANLDGARSRFLDDPAARSAAQSDPVRFVRQDGPLLIDEVQRVPGLWLAIKNEVDRDPRPGRFLLTGSARLLGLSSLPDALPGRSETIELWPLSQGEIDGAPDGFVDAVFEREALASEQRDSRLRRRDYLNRALRGGYPEVVRREHRRCRGEGGGNGACRGLPGVAPASEKAGRPIPSRNPAVLRNRVAALRRGTLGAADVGSLGVGRLIDGYPLCLEETRRGPVRRHVSDVDAGPARRPCSPL
jgi:hypothetical protein